MVSGVSDRRARRRAATLAKLNVKTGPPLVDILLFSIIWVVVFLHFSGCFQWFLAAIDIHEIQSFTTIS